MNETFSIGTVVTLPVTDWTNAYTNSGLPLKYRLCVNKNDTLVLQGYFPISHRDAEWREIPTHYEQIKGF